MRTRIVTHLLVSVLLSTDSLLAESSPPSDSSAAKRSVADHAVDTPNKPAVALKVLRSDKLLARHDGQPTKASMIEVTFAPSAASMPHRHPGPVCGYVLEGTLEFQIGDQPLRVLHAGDTFFEPTLILHRVARNPDPQKQCRVLVTMIHPAAATRLTIPETGILGSSTKPTEQ